MNTTHRPNAADLHETENAPTAQPVPPLGRPVTPADDPLVLADLVAALQARERQDAADLERAEQAALVARQRFD